MSVQFKNISRFQIKKNIYLYKPSLNVLKTKYLYIAI